MTGTGIITAAPAPEALPGLRLALGAAVLGRPGTPVLEGLDLDVAPGEILTVVGPSGCGKSTLLRTLAGLLPLLGGRLSQDGRPVEGPAADRALVFQEDALLPWRTLRANVELPWRSGAWHAPSAGRGRTTGWPGSDSASTPRACRTTSPAASGGAPSWPARWPGGRVRS